MFIIHRSPSFYTLKDTNMCDILYFSYCCLAQIWLMKTKFLTGFEKHTWETCVVLQCPLRVQSCVFLWWKAWRIILFDHFNDICQRFLPPISLFKRAKNLLKIFVLCKPKKYLKYVKTIIDDFSSLRILLSQEICYRLCTQTRTHSNASTRARTHTEIRTRTHARARAYTHTVNLDWQQ